MTQATRAGERPLLTLSMIVKNEEQDLARCLRSAQHLVDEIVIVDTGSTDRTVEIAQSFGARVSYFAWCDDFAAARNAALADVRGQWVLHLDADEVAVEREVGALRAELARQPEQVLFLRVPVRSSRPDGLGHDIYGARRVFRNRPNVRWHRPIHETIGCLDGTTDQMDASCASLIVDHDGYANPTVRAARGKNTRNMRLLKREIAAHTEDPTLHHYLALEYSAIGQFPTALRTIKAGIRKFSGRVRPDFEGAMHCLAMRYAMTLGRVDEAIRLGRKAVKNYAFSELCYLLGCAYVKKDDLVQAERYFELALSLRTRFAEYQMDAGTGSWKPLIELGGLAMLSGDRELALDRLRRAHDCAPDQALPNLCLGKGLAMVGRVDEALPYLRRAIEVAPTMREAHLRLTQALSTQGDHQAAYDHLDGLTRAHPEVVEYWQWLGDLLYELSEYEACVAVLGQAIVHHQDRAMIYHRLGSALRKTGRNQDALNAHALAAALDPNLTEARVGLAMAAHAAEWNLSVSRSASGVA